MNKEIMAKIKKESRWFLIVFIVFIAVLKIAFFKEGFFNIFMLSVGIFWSFVIPGFLFMYCWHEKIDFSQRMLIGTALGTGIVSISSYYISLAGLHIEKHIILLPAVFVVIALLFLRRSF